MDGGHRMDNSLHGVLSKSILYIASLISLSIIGYKIVFGDLGINRINLIRCLFTIFLLSSKDY